MHCIEQNKEFFDKPVSLTLKERSNPSLVLEGFFDQFTLSDIRIHLYALLHTAITGDDDEFTASSDRKNITWFIQQTELMCEAAYLQCTTLKVV